MGENICKAYHVEKSQNVEKNDKSIGKTQNPEENRQET